MVFIQEIIMVDVEKIKAIANEYQNGLVLKDKQIATLLHIQQRKGDILVNLPVGYGKWLSLSNVTFNLFLDFGCTSAWCSSELVEEKVESYIW